ncbi:GNAT family N-acetyltransferase [Paenibacillus macquariensis]|nr:GNAT family N-acetyltransferase [Paenibacillus macquariensis]OAB33094.1 hypothetical protein PMSM_16195 [Paenibacillus macquariensis subsp. macquariensis]
MVATAKNLGILPAYEGQGYASEVVRLLLHFAFVDPEAHKVVNTRSSALMDRLRMTREAVYKEEFFLEAAVDRPVFLFNIGERIFHGKFGKEMKLPYKFIEKINQTVIEVKGRRQEA